MFFLGGLCFFCGNIIPLNLFFLNKSLSFIYMIPDIIIRSFFIVHILVVEIGR